MDNKITRCLFVHGTEERAGKEAAKIALEIAKERGLEITADYVSLREVIGYVCDKLGNRQQNNPRTETFERANLIYTMNEMQSSELQNLNGMLEGTITCLSMQTNPMTESHWGGYIQELKDKLSLRMPRRDS